ncbi:MAG: autotransporter domain-containing protein, partial [Psychrilyobacter sp.]|nr:autotransporter domain-containing protein [Psychrilyobacter sp.]
TGYFVNAKGGTMGSTSGNWDNVTGKMYISGDFGENNFNNSINYTGILKANNFNANTISMSPLYSIKSSGLNSNKEFTMEISRVKFTSGIVADKNVGRLLEDNYSNSNNSYKNSFYNLLKGTSIDSTAKLNSALNSTFGTTIFPTLTKQTFDTISRLNINGIYNIANFNPYSKVGTVNVNGTFDNSHLKVKNVESDNNYKSSNSDMSFWIEKKLTPNFKLGTIQTFSDSSVSMSDDNTYRDDYYYSGGIYGVYEHNLVLYTTQLTVGGNYSHLNRYNNTGVGDFRNSSTNKNLFLGLNNLVYKRYSFNHDIYIVPKGEFNIVGLHQGEINEGGASGMDIHSKNTTSIEPGIGFDLGKDFYYNDIHKFSLSSGVMNYYELADPYDNLEANFKPFGDSVLTLNKYNNDPYHVKFTLKEGYEYSDYLGIAIHQDYTLSRHQYQFEYGANITYKF